MSEPPWSGDPEALLAHAGCVRGLARTLVVDPNRADDVVQQAWIEALERPPAHARNLSAWLGRVVRNSARQLGRRDRRRARREDRVRAVDSAPPTEELVEQAEMQREVVSAVLELEEPYRTTILLRYWRDHSPQEIARMQTVPPGTVRSRLHRAHEELRRKLDRRYQGDRSAWSSVLCAWIRAGEGAQVAGASSAAAWLGGIGIMGWKLWGSVAVVLAVLVTWRIWPEAPASAAAEEAQSTERVATLPVDPPSPSAGEEAIIAIPSQPAGSREPAVVDPPPDAYHGTVCTPEGSPIANAVLTLYPDVDDWEEQAPRGTGSCDETGSFRIEDYLPDPEGFVIRAEAEGFQSQALRSISPERAIELTLHWRVAIVGHVRDAETGEPVAGAQVLWFREPGAITDAEGRYRLEDAPTYLPDYSTLYMRARAEGFAEDPIEIELHGPDDATVDFELHRGVPLLVEVFDRETGDPIIGADVHSHPAVSPLTQTDGNGQCEVRVLPNREMYLVAKAEDYYPFNWYHESGEMDRILSPRIPLTPLGTIEGRVTDDAGNPLAGVVVGTTPGWAFSHPGKLTKEEREALDLPGMAGPDALLRLEAQTDAQGVFRLSVYPDTEPREVWARHPDDRSGRSEPIRVTNSQQRPWVEIVLGGGATVRGRVLFNGEPLEGLDVSWEADEGDRAGSDYTNRSGEYELTHVEPGEVTIRVRSSDYWLFGPLPEVNLVVEAGKSYAQDLAWSCEQSEITGRITSSSGEPLSDLYVYVSIESPEHRHGWDFLSSTKDDGTYAVVVRAGETYRVVASREPLEQLQRNVAHDATGVDFVFPDFGVLPVQLVDAVTGEPVQTDTGGCGLNWRESGSGTFVRYRGSMNHAGRTDLHLPVGTVDLSVHPHELGFAPASVHGVRVTRNTPGEPVVIELVRGVVGSLVLVNENGEPDAFVGDHEWLLLEDSQRPLFAGPFPGPGDSANATLNEIHVWLGDPDLKDQVFRPDAEGRTRIPALAPGRYTLRAFPDDLSCEPTTIQLTGEEADPIEIRCRPR